MSRNALEHFKTITKHKWLVMQGCFKIGLYKQGILHDMSKYTPSEFLIGCRYYQGDRSPNDAERRKTGYSTAWMHHKGRNRHHFEYWIDYNISQTEIPMAGVRMPRRYVAEMVMDRIAASKTYNGEAYQDSDPLTYFLRGKHHYMMHDETSKELEKLLRILAKRGEKALYRYIRKVYLK